jgi:hypothetical protein
VAKRISIPKVRAVEGRWQATALFEGHETVLTSELDATAYDESLAREAFVHVIAIVSERSAAIREACAAALIDAYNTSWRQGRTPKLSAATFAKKLVFERVHASEPDHPSRLITLQLGCADLLGGHTLGCVLGWDGTPLFAPALVP